MLMLWERLSPELPEVWRASLGSLGLNARRQKTAPVDPRDQTRRLRPSPRPQVPNNLRGLVPNPEFGGSPIRQEAGIPLIMA